MNWAIKIGTFQETNPNPKTDPHANPAQHVCACASMLQTIANNCKRNVWYCPCYHRLTLILILILKGSFNPWLKSQSSHAYPLPLPMSLLRIPLLCLPHCLNNLNNSQEPCCNYLTQGGEGSVLGLPNLSLAVHSRPQLGLAFMNMSPPRTPNLWTGVSSNWTGAQATPAPWWTLKGVRRSSGPVTVVSIARS